MAPAPALSRICVIIVHLCSQIGPDVQTNTRHAGYLTRLKKGGPKVKMHSHSVSLGEHSTIKQSSPYGYGLGGIPHGMALHGIAVAFCNR